MTASELLELAESQGLENIARIKKQDLVFQLLRAAARRGEQIHTEGVLEIMQDGYGFLRGPDSRSEEHTSELQSLMRISYAVFCLKKKTDTNKCTSMAYHRTLTNPNIKIFQLSYYAYIAASALVSAVI